MTNLTTEPAPPLLSTNEAAAHLGITRAGVFHLIERGLIAATKYKYRWLIPLDEAERYARERRKPGAQCDPSEERRFWAKVRKSDGCWEWTAKRNRKGYGDVRYQRKMQGAHRVAWQLTYGPIPKRRLVCHHCDNPSCVRPDHLFLGTEKDNSDDCVRKGRNAKGERTRRAKLIAAQVREIRQRYAQGDTSASRLAREFGVCSRTIYSIVNYASWCHIS